MSPWGHATLMLVDSHLHCPGVHHRSLANKIVALYRLCGELLSSELHYDWGLRAVKRCVFAYFLVCVYQIEHAVTLTSTACCFEQLTECCGSDAPISSRCYQ